MTGDGVKTDRRSKSKRNKIGQAIGFLAAIAATAEQSFPDKVPYGTGQFAAQIGGLAILAVNNLVRS